MQAPPEGEASKYPILPASSCPCRSVRCGATTSRTPRASSSWSIRMIATVSERRAMSCIAC
eukprot:355623-Chlamydomonas_euryale.AAC.5